MDWWYIRAYPGHADLMDEATRVLLPWLADQAACEHAPAWFFTRYWDMTGHHLRLRLRCPADAADRLHDRIPEVLDLLRGLRTAPVGERLIPGSVPTGLTGARRVKPCLYSPELAKYGGARGVALAEELYTTACFWYVDNDLAALAPRYDRAALAVALMRSFVRAALPDEEQRRAFWAGHRRQWGWQLRMSVPRQEDFRVLLSRTADGVAAVPDIHRRLRRGVDERAEAVARTLDRAGCDTNPVPRPMLLLHYLHMELNRCGFVPAEECLLGLVAAS